MKIDFSLFDKYIIGSDFWALYDMSRIGRQTANDNSNEYELTFSKSYIKLEVYQKVDYKQINRLFIFSLNRIFNQKVIEIFF